MIVGVIRLSLHLHDNRSLKGKRKIVRSLIDRTRAKFNAAVAEVGSNDNLKQIVIGVTVVGNDSSHVDSMLGSICQFVDHLNLAPVVGQNTELIPLGDQIGAYGDFPASYEFDR